MKISPRVAEKYPNLQAVINRFFPDSTKETGHWDGKVHHALTLVGAEPEKLVWEFKVEDKHCNQMDNVQGGCVATVIDLCSNFALVVHEGQHKWTSPGISSEISVNYLRGISTGDTARLECEVLQVGKSLANIYSKMYDSKGALCYSSFHSLHCLEPRI